MNITEDGIKKYIDVFYETLNKEAERFFSAEEKHQILHLSLLPAKITCFVSTKFGVAIEYSKSEDTKVESIRGSDRIEHLFVGAPRRLQEVGPMFNIGGSGCHISKLTLADGFPFLLSKEDASVIFSEARFSCEALKWSRDIEYAEIYASRLAENWSEGVAKNRAKDEILSALFIKQEAEKNEKGIYEYLDRFREKSVLLLGSYDEAGKARLAAIEASLIKNGYSPVLIKNVPDIEHYDISQKVTAVGTICKFVIIDDSSPSGHLTEIEICRVNRWATILLRENGAGASWMSAGVSITSNVMCEEAYTIDTLDSIVEKITSWAESKIEELKKRLNELYPWRKNS
jgi:hypothetical protein